MQYKHGAALLSVKASDEAGQFEGYASTFGGEPDSYGDVIAKGAYTDTLAKHRSNSTMPKMFWQHDPDQPIGKWLDMKEDDTGLWVKGQLNMGVQKAREAHELLKAGDIDGMSIGYRIKGYEKDDATGVWTLTKLDLFEVSIVSIGANASALISSVKSERKQFEIIDKLKAGDRLTEREFEELAKGLGLSNSQAERAARIHLKGQGEPVKAADEALEFFRALKSHV